MRKRNKYNPNLAVHPLGKYEHPRIDVISGNPKIPIHYVYAECVEIARQQIANHKDFEGVMMVNMLTNPVQMTHDAKYAVSARNDDSGQFKEMTIRTGEFVKNLKFFDTVMRERKIRTLIVCGLEFAAESSRHKRIIVNWLKDQMDHNYRQIIVSTILPLATSSVDATLAQLSKSVAIVGSYAHEFSEQLPERISGIASEPKADYKVNDDVLEPLGDIESEAPATPDEKWASEVLTKAATDNRTEAGHVGEVSDPVHAETLKTKDLA